MEDPSNTPVSCFLCIVSGTNTEGLGVYRNLLQGYLPEYRALVSAAFLRRHHYLVLLQLYDDRISRRSHIALKRLTKRPERGQAVLIIGPTDNERYPPSPLLYVS